MMGADFSEPVPGDTNAALKVLIFGSKETYQEYMSTFVGFGRDAGGLYVEGDGILYTYDRSADGSTKGLEHLLDHEHAHYLQGRFVFPGVWGDEGYHTEPKAMGS
jgi:microbial collagenase